MSDRTTQKQTEALALAEAINNEEGTTDLEQYLVFEVQGGVYGVDILQTQEVLKPVRSTRVPNSPPEMLGVINLRGNIVPVIDLSKKFGHAYSTVTPATRIIVCAFAEKLTGLLVDRVLETARIPAGSIESTEVRGLSRQYVVGAGRSSTRIFLLMNPAAAFIPD